MNPCINESIKHKTMNQHPLLDCNTHHALFCSFLQAERALPLRRFPCLPASSASLPLPSRHDRHRQPHTLPRCRSAPACAGIIAGCKSLHRSRTGASSGFVGGVMRRRWRRGRSSIGRSSIGRSSIGRSSIGRCIGSPRTSPSRFVGGVMRR